MTAALDRMIIPQLLLSIFAVVAAAMVSAAMTWAIRPWLLRHALAKPNARSSHRIPTPQGAGIAVIGATLIVACAVVAYADAVNLNVLIAIFAAGGGRAPISGKSKSRSAYDLAWPIRPLS